MEVGMEKVEIRGYVDPRTGEYVRTTEDADPQKIHEDLAFIAAWKFYWDGDGEYTRVAWLASEARVEWLAQLTEEQREMLASTPPPEEVPGLRGAE